MRSRVAAARAAQAAAASAAAPAQQSIQLARADDKRRPQRAQPDAASDGFKGGMFLGGNFVPNGQSMDRRTIASLDFDLLKKTMLTQYAPWPIFSAVVFASASVTSFI